MTDVRGGGGQGETKNKKKVNIYIVPPNGGTRKRDYINGIVQGCAMSGNNKFKQDKKIKGIIKRR